MPSLGQLPSSPSPGPKRRPVQVSESLDNESENPAPSAEIEKISAETSRQNRGDGAEEPTPTTINNPTIELQVAFNSNVLIDVDPEMGPISLSNVAFRHLSAPVDGVSRSQEPSPTRGSNPNADVGKEEELICVKRGTLVLDQVTLLVNGGVGISVHEGATLKMKNCVISGARGAAIVAHPSAVVEIGDVKFLECGAEVVKTAALGQLAAVAAVALNTAAADGE